MIATLKSLKHRARLFLAATVNKVPVSSLLLGSPRRMINSKQAASIINEGLQYHIIMQPENIIEKPPNTIDADVFFKFKTMYNRTSPEQYVLEVKNGRVWGNSGAIITQNDALLTDVSKEFGPAKFDASKHFIFKQIKLQKPVHYACSIAVIASPGTDVYGHWFGDILPRLFLLKQAGFLDKADKILVSGHMLGFHKETFAMLGIDEEKILNINNPSAHISADTLYVPSYPNAHGTVNPWVAEAIRKAFMPEKLVEAMPQNKRLFITRLKAGGRKIVNEQELFALLEKEYGFIKVVTEDFSMQEKINLFNQAECVLAPHGSGLVNIFFCRQGTKVVDIFPPGDFDTFIWSLANSAGLDFFYFFGKGQLPTQENDFTDRNADIEIDIAKFINLLSFLKLK
jgi:capsular polysaccharide biosynthesis protein